MSWRTSERVIVTGRPTAQTCKYWNVNQYCCLLYIDGLMELNTFVQLVSEFRHEGDSEEEILEAFRVFDPQFTGVVSVAQFRQVMMNYGERLSENDVDDLIALADVDRKGDIRYMGEKYRQSVSFV